MTSIVWAIIVYTICKAEIPDSGIKLIGVIFIIMILLTIKDLFK